MAKKKPVIEQEPEQGFLYKRSQIRGRYVLDVPGMKDVPASSRYAGPKPADKCRVAVGEEGSTNCPIQFVFPRPDGPPYLRLCDKKNAPGALVPFKNLDEAYDKAVAVCRSAGYILPGGRKTLSAAAKAAGVALERDAKGRIVLGALRRPR